LEADLILGEFNKNTLFIFYKKIINTELRINLIKFRQKRKHLLFIYPYFVKSPDFCIEKINLNIKK